MRHYWGTGNNGTIYYYAIANSLVPVMSITRYNIITWDSILFPITALYNQIEASDISSYNQNVRKSIIIITLTGLLI